MTGFTKCVWGSLCLAGAVIIGIPAVAQAQPDTGGYDFTAPPGDQGTSLTLDSTPPGAGSITATPQTDPAPLHLFVTARLGLGILDPANNNRIRATVDGTPGDFVQLDLRNLTIPPLTSPNLSFRADGLIPAADGSAAEWAVFGSNEDGICNTDEGCEEILTGTNTELQDLGPIVGDFRFLDIMSLNGGVLLNEIDASFIPVPEPASLALLATGIIGLGLLFQRRRASTHRPALQ